MTQDPPQAPEGDAPHGAGPAPDVTAQRLLDRWDLDTWRSPAAGVAVGVLTLPAVAMVLVGLLVLAVQGQATWLVVSAAALVTTVIGALGAAVGLRRGHRGVVRRLAVLAAVWAVVVIVTGVALALSLVAPERVAVTVLLVLGGTYALVLALGLWGASHLMTPPVAQPVEVPEERVGPTHTGATPTVNSVPTPAVAPDDDALADWPEWGGEAAQREAAQREAAEREAAEQEAARREAVARETAAREAAAREAAAREAAAREAAAAEQPAPRRTGPVPPRGTKPTRPAPKVVDAGRVEDVVDADVVEVPSSARRTSAASRPARRSVTSAGPAGPRRTSTSPDPATERITRQDGDDGPPTQRLPPVEP